MEKRSTTTAHGIRLKNLRVVQRLIRTVLTFGYAQLDKECSVANGHFFIRTFYWDDYVRLKIVENFLIILNWFLWMFFQRIVQKFGYKNLYTDKNDDI